MQQKGSFLFVGEKALCYAAGWAMAPMTAGATVAEHQEVKCSVRCGVAVVVVDHQTGLINPALRQLSMLPANALAHLADFALD